MKLLFLIWREWRLRYGRAILTALSVAFAVAIVFGSSLAASMVRRAYSSVSQALEGPPVLEIVAAKGGRFEIGSLPQFGKLESVRESIPMLSRPSSIFFNGKRWRTLVLGLGKRESPAWSRLELTAGRMPQNPDEAIIDAGVAKNFAMTVPCRVNMLAKRGSVSLDVVGVVASGGLRDYGDGVTIVVPLETAQKAFGLTGLVDRLQITLDSAEHREAIRQKIAAQLPVGLLVGATASRMHLAEEILRSTELALQFAGVLSLAMAAFIIVNTLRMNFSERRWQYAVMRAIGATAPQIRGLVMIEGLMFGLLGLVLGLPSGLALAYVLSQAMQTMLGAALPTTMPEPKSLVLGVTVGPLVALLAAWFVAWQSRKLSPLEGIQGVEPAGLENYPRRALMLSFAAWLAAAACLTAVALSVLPVFWAIPAGLIMMVAFILLIPAVIRPLMQGFLRLLPRSLATLAFIASRQARMKITRISLTVGILVVAICYGLGLGHAILNNVADVRGWYQRTMSGDYFLQPVGTAAVAANAMGSDLSPKIRAISGVTRVEPVCFRPAKANDEPVTCVLREFDPSASLLWNMDKQQEENVRHQLEQQQAVVSSVLAKRLALKPGDNLRLEVQGRAYPITVATVVNDYSMGGLVVFLDRRAAELLFHSGSPDLYVITRAPQSPADLEKNLQTLAAKEGLLLQSFEELRLKFDRLINGIVSSLFVLMAIGYIVGGLGVSNTLAMSVLEQTREIGLLRIIGMTRRQVRRLVLVEGLMIGTIGALLGALAGATTAYVIHLCNWVLLDRSVAFELHGWLLISSIGGCVLVAILASWAPARRATQLDLLTAMSYE